MIDLGVVDGALSRRIEMMIYVLVLERCFAGKREFAKHCPEGPYEESLFPIVHRGSSWNVGILQPNIPCLSYPATLFRKGHDVIDIKSRFEELGLNGDIKVRQDDGKVYIATHHKVMMTEPIQVADMDKLVNECMKRCAPDVAFGYQAGGDGTVIGITEAKFRANVSPDESDHTLGNVVASINTSAEKVLAFLTEVGER